MRKLFGILAASALLFAGTTATAAPVGPGTATLSIVIANVATVSLTGAGSISVTGSSVKVGAGLVSQTGPAIVIALTGTTAIQSLTLTGLANAAGTFTPGGGTAGGEGCAGVTVGVACNQGGGIGGAMGLVGTVNVRVNFAVNIPVKLSTALLGQGGTFLTPKSSISGDAGLWTTGVAQVAVTATITTPNGATVTGVTVPVTSAGSGSPLTLVTPTFVNAFSGLVFLPLFATFSFVPEPGTLLLLASGVAGLALVGRRRSQVRSPSAGPSDRG